jgi:biopolymer transport protein TolR
MTFERGVVLCIQPGPARPVRSSVWLPSKVVARRAAKRRSNFYTSINMWAFVSVMLALLFLFIGDTTPHRYRYVAVDLPVVQNAVSQPSAVREDVIRVVVARDGSVYFRLARIHLEDLSERIRTALQEGAEKKIYLAADQRAKNGDVESVLDQIRLAGITNVVILAERPAR